MNKELGNGLLGIAIGILIGGVIENLVIRVLVFTIIGLIGIYICYKKETDKEVKGK